MDIRRVFSFSVSEMAMMCNVLCAVLFDFASHKLYQCSELSNDALEILLSDGQLHLVSCQPGYRCVIVA